MLTAGNMPRLLAMAGVSTLVFGIVSITTHHMLYSSVLHSKLELSPDSELYPYWYSAPFPMYTRFYFWNVTNSRDVIDFHDKPQLQELGPYTYLEKHHKVNVKWNSNDTVTYMRIKSWFFLPDKSNGSLEDRVTSLNVPLLAAADRVTDMAVLAAGMFSMLVESVDSQPFVTHTVGQLLFDGAADPILAAASGAQAAANLPPSARTHDKFGWFYARNGTPYFDGVVAMATGGGGDAAHLGVIRTWNHSDISTAFRAECGAMNGSAGELFPPGLGRDQVVIFASDVCRSLTVPFEKEVTLFDVQLNRYSADKMMFGSPEVNPDNWCNCNGPCAPSGLLDQSRCRFKMKIYRVSLPHMLFADADVINQTVGQKPDKDKHNFYIDLEPTLGVPMSARVRFQMNILLKPNPYIRVLERVPTVNVPMLWFEMLADTQQSVANKVFLITVTVPAVMAAGSWATLGMGVLLLALAGLAWLRNVADPPPK